MIGEEFYATLKLTSGEEIFSKVSPMFIKTKDHKKTNNNIKDYEFHQLLLHCPVIVTEVISPTHGLCGYKMESWLKSTSDDTFVINKCDIITLNESNNESIIKMYETYLKKFKETYSNNIKNELNNSSNKLIDREHGYIGDINEVRTLLEKIWVNS